MGADGGADGVNGQFALGVASPQCRAVLDILLEHRIRKARIAERQRHGKVDAACLFDLLVEQVTAVLGTARLAQLHDQTVLGSHDRLHVEQRAHSARRSRQAAAAHQVLQRLEQADDDHAVAHGLDSIRDLSRAAALVHQAQGILDQHALAQGNVIAIHHVHIAARGLGKCGAGTLIGARKLSAHGNNHSLIAGLTRLGNRLRKRVRVDLAGLGQLIALHEHLVKALVIDVDAIHVHIGAKGDGQRQNMQSGVLSRRHIACGIGNNADGHNESFLAQVPRGEF